MRSRRMWMKAAVAGLAIGSMVFASTVFTEGFESGFADGTQFADLYPEWYASPDGTNDASPAIEYGSGVPGALSGLNQVGIQPGSRAARWNAHEFDWSDPAVTGVVMQADFETVWATFPPDPYSDKPFDNDNLGWMVNPFSVSGSDMFGVQLEGDEIRATFRLVKDSDKSETIGTLSSWDYETFYRLRVEYSKTGIDPLNGSIATRMDVSVTELNPDGTPGAVVGSGYFDTAEYNAGASNDSKYVNPAQMQGPMWLAFRNYNNYPGNMDNIYLEIIPEPATAILLACGGLVIFRRKRG